MIFFELCRCFIVCVRVFEIVYIKFVHIKLYLSSLSSNSYSLGRSHAGGVSFNATLVILRCAAERKRLH